MTTELSPGQRPTQAFRRLIDAGDKADSTRTKYKKALDNAPAAEVDPAGRASIRAYAATLSHSGRARLTADYRAELQARVTLDTLYEVQVKLMRLNAIASAITVQQAKGEKAHIRLSEDEVIRLLRTCHTRTIKGKRDRLVLSLLVGAGLRREAMAGPAFADIVLQPISGKLRTVLNIRGKGAKNRVVPISDEPAALLDDRAFTVGGTGLVGRAVAKGDKVRESISAVGLFNIVRQHGTLIGRPELAPHDLRRTYARIGYESQIPLDQISRLLGHATIATTQRYLNLELNLDLTISDFVPLA